ncbi:sensor histidine kinase [Parasediminibacterium sp. JCM 36343]|uniref:sensor histidine kinase n=1 Tax=Parasediminibacterium sp. JCM 36343 TaxID=3374279 RepID=UPI00397814D8
MKNKTRIYWYCQIGGWLSYGFLKMLFALTADQSMIRIRFGMLISCVVFGFLFTLLLRMLIKKLHLATPLSKRSWWVLLTVVAVTSFLYSIADTTFIVFMDFYPHDRVMSLPQRTLFNFISDSTTTVAWTSFYYLWHYIEINNNSEFDKIRLESLVKDLELKTIKSHINPHFIFNALNSIRALVDENPESARTAITQLSNILRSSMQAEKLELAPMERELNIVKDYLALEKIRFEDRLAVEYSIDENTLDLPVPPMMLQTLVENALKHGIGKLKHGGSIKIISKFCNHHHEMIVQNTGHLQENNDTEGFGITSTVNRLNLLYGKEAIFKLKETTDNMVQAKVSIPL